MGGNPVDPIQSWHNKNKPVQEELRMPLPSGSWKPYKDDTGDVEF